MPKSNGIRWRESDAAELQRLARNYNAKIRRLEKSHPELSGVLPERVKASELASNIESRSEFNALKRSLSGFTKRGSEKVVESATRGTTTKWQAHEDKKQINRIVGAFNKKLDRVATIDNIDYLPSKLDRKEVKEEIRTPEDFKHFVERHTGFLKEGAEKVVSSTRGAKSTQWEIEEFYRNQERENERRRKKLEEIGKKEVKIAGEGTGVTRAEMGKIKENEVKESKKKFENMSMEEWERASRLFEKKMQSTYTDKATHDKLVHYCVGLETQGLSDIVELMKRVPLDKFLELLDTDEVADFDFIYDPVELEVRRERLRTLWEQYATNETEHNLEYVRTEENGEQVLCRL
ncbi:MAG: hypothetical protein IJX16_00255 [Clostridia bacterium]|nr:hypothetical protein [Clostridia bacterium]